MKVVIYEPGFSGHRLHYVSLIIKALAELKITPVLATTQQAFESSEFEGHLRKLDLLFTKIIIPEFTLLTAKTVSLAARQFKIFDGIVSQFKPDHILIPTAEQLMRALSYGTILRKAFRKHKPVIEGMFFSPGYGYRFDSAKRNISNFVLKHVSRRLPFDSYFHPDPYQLAAIADGQREENRFIVMPDPVPKPPSISTIEARRLLNIPTIGRYAAICGGISASKGVHDLIDAFSQALPRLKEEDRLLLAGPFDNATKKLVFESHCNLVDQQRIVTIDRPLFGSEFDMTFKAINLYCAVQEGRPGSSSTMLRAATSGKPVLARDRFWSGKIVKQFELGWVSKTWDSEVFSDDLVKSFNAASQFKQSDSCCRYLEFHREENFQAIWTSKIRESLGLLAEDNLRTWSTINSKASSDNKC